MQYNTKYPLKHISIRVPWHDNKWNGTVCNNPKQNNSCLVLKNCALERDDEGETTLAGKSLEVLNEPQYPVCVKERGTFMAPFDYQRVLRHPYAKYQNGPYKALTDTPVTFPKYSAAAVPFNWMLPIGAEEKASHYNLDFNLEREPYHRFGRQESLRFTQDWIQALENQKALLNCFFEHIQPQKSLSFFYAKDVPFVESSGRVVVGVGRVSYVGDGKEYDYEGETDFRAMSWEHMIGHTIRPEEKDGFLLPYYEALEYQKEHPKFDPEQLAVIIPSEYHFEFSFASEHVSHDSALFVLRECIKKIELARELGIGKGWDTKLVWLHDRISEVEELRGDYPGLGAVLKAFGLERGHFVAQDVFNRIGPDECPWDYLDKVFQQPEKNISENLVKEIKANQALWTYVKGKRVRISLFQLLSRFNLSIEQAMRLIDETKREDEYQKVSDAEILENPYLIYEVSINSIDLISLMTIDNGLMLNRGRGLLPDREKVFQPLSIERIRALTVYQLERATQEGHTLLPQGELIKRISKMPIDPPCPLTIDHFELSSTIFRGKLVQHTTAEGDIAFQLDRLDQASSLINETINKRLTTKRHLIEEDWGKHLSERIEFKADASDQRAKEEKILALKELTAARFSVLIGPAGSGKTTLLNVLASLPSIKSGNVLMLAPTGKAKVRMELGAKEQGITTMTIAQFLHKSKRFRGRTQTYHLIEDAPKEEGFKTVIIDECSMLTEEMLAATIQNLKRVERLILVGDFRQLPPIGAGRPFVDIVNFIRPEDISSKEFRIGPSYVELTGSYRQKGRNRLDLEFANLFGGEAFTKKEDEIFTKVVHSENNRIQFIQWENEGEFEELLEGVLRDHLEINDEDSFNLSLGANEKGYFNYGAAEFVEKWQILCPVKAKTPGTVNLNRFLHKKFKNKFLSFAQSNHVGLPKPAGTQEIIYGDKVINLMNHKRKAYPEGSVNYLANGEIGIVIGQTKPARKNYKGKDKWKKPQYIHVEFSSQKNYSYSFTSGDFSEEGEASLELAYALTIHKAQGSQFDTVILVIPDPCLLLSRELIYTALTRQKDRVVVLYQGNPQRLLNYTNDYYSSTLQRITNLFYKPSIQEYENQFFERNLIHCASDGTMLRSKSEVIIYETLKQYGLDPQYEYRLELNSELKRPDFFLENDDTGEKFYWEHLGMLGDEHYYQDWEEKKKWYYENGIKLFEDGGGENGTLIVTKDNAKGGISLKEIRGLIENIFNVKPKLGIDKVLDEILKQNKELRDAISGIEGKIGILVQDLLSVKGASLETEVKVRQIYEIIDQSTDQHSFERYKAIIEREFVNYTILEPNSLQFLVSAYFLFEKLEKADASDYSPYVIQYSRTIESELLHKIFLPFYDVLAEMKPEARESLLEAEFSNEKSGVLAKMLYKEKKDFTLGMMEKVFSFIRKPDGDSLSQSPLFISFREHVISRVDERFLSKKIIGGLNEITMKYRNKAAHVEPLHKDLALSFSELGKEVLKEFLNDRL